MRKLVILFLIISAGHSAWPQDGKDFIVLTNGDTLPCLVWSWKNGSLFSKPKVTVDTGDGLYLSYSTREIIAFTKGDSIFWSIPFRPWKKGSNKMVWAQVIMKNKNHYFLKYENVIQAEMGPHYELVYYYYRGSNFVEEISNGNCREILEKYFSDCPYIRDLLTKKRNFFRNDRISKVADEYRERCCGDTKF